LLLSSLTLVVQLVKHKDTFMSATSHELRTPLHAIMGLSQGVLGGSCGEVSTELHLVLKTIENSGARLLHLVNTILDR
jgi:signal transduction histidine kinase